MDDHGSGPGVPHAGARGVDEGPEVARPPGPSSFVPTILYETFAFFLDLGAGRDRTGTSRGIVGGASWIDPSA